MDFYKTKYDAYKLENERKGIPEILDSLVRFPNSKFYFKTKQ